MNILTKEEVILIEKERQSIIDRNKDNISKKLLKLNNLYNELIELLPDSKSIDKYADLLWQDLSLYSPEGAYSYSKKANPDSTDINILLKYLCFINDNKLQSDILIKFIDLSNELKTNSRLISEFTSLYKEIHGVIMKNIDRFLNMGFENNNLKEYAQKSI